MKIRLSMPSTISSAESMNKLSHASGEERKSNIALLLLCAYTILSRERGSFYRIPKPASHSFIQPYAYAVFDHSAVPVCGAFWSYHSAFAKIVYRSTDGFE